MAVISIVAYLWACLTVFFGYVASSKRRWDVAAGWYALALVQTLWFVGFAIVWAL